ncbi:histidine ammonia-lyase [Psychrobacillus lasiicapitis]|uniref:Histidine ammonia-lyase n=1 Tax=Psychrobacillus lasiicapitis TaxID=1636719 RepID=A0A544SX48_9BACI|nr:histidine ammonia-lyase [Psychrobacillus lasiicapitis]TQR09783.1 histidine ammonia-lyase [Psychrobacillus lasiicapitis]GGA23471.1 histidine ammonia-lyase [Psychrobacillus lasiicapitis]
MISLKGNGLTLENMRALLYQNEQVKLEKTAIEAVVKSRKAVETIVKDRRIVYGINTGFGKFSDVSIDEENVRVLQLHLIRSHACGIGQPFDEIVSRAMLILRLNALLKGFSGIRLEVLERLAYMVNHRIHPVIPQQGSLGASGDLAPLSHLALVLIGEGFVWDGEKHIASKKIWAKHNLQPIILEAKEGLALINGTQAMTAQGVVNWLESETLAYQTEWIAAMSMEALHGITDAFHPAIHEARGYSEQVGVAQRMLKWLEGSKLVTKQGEKRVQDAYSLRCIPQIHGASWQVLEYVKEKLEIEMNAATDNPLIVDNGDTVISGGNFHGQSIAFAMDFLKIGIAELANVSERRIERLVNPQLNEGLPPFLSPQPGLQSGAMILQYAAASLVSENKTLAHPASVDSIPSSANQEDHVSMGTIGARHASQIIQNARRVLAIEALCATQGVEYRGVNLMSPSLFSKWEDIRKIIPSITEDRIFHKDIEKLNDYLKKETIKNK